MRSEREAQEVGEPEVAGYENQVPLYDKLEYCIIGLAAETDLANIFGLEVVRSQLGSE